MPRRQHAEHDGDRDRHQQRQQRELERPRQRVGDQLGDRLLEAERVAEVALHDAARERAQLRRDRAVGAEVGSVLLDHLGAGEDRGAHPRRIAGGDAQDQEDAERDRDDDEERLQQAAGDVAAHHATRGARRASTRPLPGATLDQEAVVVRRRPQLAQRPPGLPRLLLARAAGAPQLSQPQGGALVEAGVGDVQRDVVVGPGACSRSHAATVRARRAGRGPRRRRARGRRRRAPPAARRPARAATSSPVTPPSPQRGSATPAGAGRNGGLATTRSNRSPATGASSEPSRTSIARPFSAALKRATPAAKGSISTATTSAAGASSACRPAPAQRSSARAPGRMPATNGARKSDSGPR